MTYWVLCVQIHFYYDYYITFNERIFLSFEGEYYYIYVSALSGTTYALKYT